MQGDAEAVALRERGAPLRRRQRERAGRAFARLDSLEARVGQAFSAWPEGTVDRLNRLAGLHPQRAVVQLNLGVALFWSGLGGAEDAWRAAAASEPDTPYAVAAGNLLHPDYARGLPVFVTTAPLPDGLDRLAPAAQLDASPSERVERRAPPTSSCTASRSSGSVSQRSAVRVFDTAARQAPDDAEAQVAAAVGRFDKARPAEAFSRLGPLTRRFPDKATVRFHLGLLLLWSGEVKQARTQLVRATTVEPGSPLAGEARKLLAELKDAGI